LAVRVDTRKRKVAIAWFARASLLVLLLAGATPTIPVRAAGACGPPVASVIACENTLTGDPSSDWAISGSGSPTIQGFATDISVNKGGTVFFKISTPSTSYHFDILRLGYYQGNGARKVAAGLRPSASLRQTQPACATDSASGLVDCGNWSVSASWTVPSNAVSGIYFAHLVRDDIAGESHIYFIVRDDSSTSDLLFQTSDTTWQAYNQYGGNSLYVGGPGTNPSRAYKVSYNRPITNADTDPRNWVFSGEYQMVRFMESNGYDVSYTTGVDSDRNGALIRQHKVFLSVGHDEYWSGNQFVNVQAARDAGVNLAFFSGNEIFWKTRWESSIAGTSTPYRTLVTYKETHASGPLDPQDPPTWTGTWRDPRFSPPADGGRPENALDGQYFTVNSGTTDITVPATFSKLRFWRNTSIASLAPGKVATLGSGAGTLGYEWDEDPDDGFRPPGLFDMSSTTVSVPEKFMDYGHTIAAGTATHKLTLYRAASGALVFGAGTVQWSFGLDSTNPNGAPVDPNMQQATVNLFADMGAQPYGLIAGLTPTTLSTDRSPPTSTINSPAAGTALQDGSLAIISGTAADTGGGVVAEVDVSTDGGTTWHPATGLASWTYTWSVHGSPTTTIKTRAVDDSGNIEVPGGGTSVNVSCPCSLWGASSPTPAVVSDPDSSSIEVGLKFQADVDGLVSGVRFYKGSLNTGTHIGNLWSASGSRLATATFMGETASGWQQVNFSSPVAVFANTVYVVSYFTPTGHYSDDDNYFYGVPVVAGPRSVDSPPLHALKNGANGSNGVFTYASASTFPMTGATATNFWVDVVFNPNNGPPIVTATVPTSGASGASQTGPVTATFSKTIDPTTLVFSLADSSSNPVLGSSTYNAATRTASFQPAATLAGRAGYTASVRASDTSGQPVSSPYTWSFTTGGPLLNGGFETGTLSPWTAGGVAPGVVVNTKPHSGSYSAQLGTASGAEANGDGWINQGVSVPTAGPSLSFWYWISTTDAVCSGTCQWDWFEAAVRDPAGNTLASILKLNANTQAWTKVTFDMTPYAGQGVSLWFNVHQDGSSDPTLVYVDDVALSGSQPTAPEPPTGVAATAGDARATVSWTAPSSNGGSPITGYTVASSPGAVTATAGASASSATVTGLTNGVAYTFTVTATNAIGTSAPSLPSGAVTPMAPTAPGAPTGVFATAGNGQASVGWAAPASNGGSPITGYTVTSTPGGFSTSVSGSVTSGTVTGLTNGTSYTFAVTATNTIGTGPPSTPSNAVTPSAPTVPGAPVGVTASAGNGQATVSWGAPASSGGSPITGYTVTSSPGGLSSSAGGSATSTTVSGLTNGTAYTFTVTATNAIGTGPASAPSNSVTPSAAPPPSFVQQVSAHVHQQTSVSVTPVANLNAGNRLVVLTGTWSYGAPTVSGVTDSAGNSYIELQHFTASEGTELTVWTAPITVGGGSKPTITATTTAAADLGIVVLEYAGLSTAADPTAIDQLAQGTGTTVAAGIVSSAATPATTAANELAVGFYLDSGFSNNLSYGAGFTGRANVSPAADMELLVEDQLVGVGATPQASASTGASTTWLMSTVVFKHR